MIVKTRLGALVAGTVARDPEVKTLGNSDVLILNIKAQSEKDDAGRWKSLFVDVQCWGGLTEREGMYQKGDFVAAFGREIKSRPDRPALDAAGGGHDPRRPDAGTARNGRDRRGHPLRRLRAED